MKMKFLIFLLAVSALFSQSKLTLEECRTEVKKNFPTYQNKEYLKSSFRMKSKNLFTNFYPKLTLSAQATYQSDVTEFPVKFPSSPLFTIESPESPDKDRYQFQLDVKQLIWDGGLVKSQINTEKTIYLGDSLKIESELYKLNETVNNLYFAVLLLQEKKATLEISLNDLSSKMKTVESGVKNGVMLQTSSLILKAEILNLEQQVSETDVLKKANIDMLSDLMSREISSDTEFIIPEAAEVSKDSKRLELESFDNESLKLDNTISTVESKLMPKLYGFAQTGYSKPGLNMFSNEFDSYGIVGVRAEYDISGLYTNSREKDILTNTKHIVEKQKEAFNKTLDIQLNKTLADIENYKSLLEKDKEIIAIRESILETADKQLAHGTITVNDYIGYSSALNLSRQSLRSHEIMLVQAKVNYNNLLNNQE